MPRPRGSPAPRIEPSAEVHGAPVPTPTPPLPGTVEDIGVSPLMISSLPPMASGADVYARQFYRGNKIPWRRFLPIVNQ